MQFKAYQETRKTELPPALDAGTELKKIVSIENITFDNKGVPTLGMRVHTDNGTFRTSSKVIMEILNNYFKEHAEPLENVRVVAPRGKRYLTLESLG